MKMMYYMEELIPPFPVKLFLKEHTILAQYLALVVFP